MSISYWFLLQSKCGIVPNRGTGKNFCVIFPLQPTGMVTIQRKWAAVRILLGVAKPLCIRRQATHNKRVTCASYAVIKLATLTK